MFIAQKKKQENISEYILYMWQIEDIIRALDLSDDRIESYIRQQYKVTDEKAQPIIQWYLELRDQIVDHDIETSGHIPSLCELMDELYDIHNKLLKMPSQSLYSTVFYKTLPTIVQLRGLSGNELHHEIETAFIGIYGYLTLKMGGKEVSKETLAGVKQMSTLLAMLADRYREVKDGNIILPTDQD